MTKMFNEVLRDRVYDVVSGLDDGDFYNLYNKYVEDDARDDDRIYLIGELDDLLYDESPTEILDMAAVGFDTRKSDYCRFNGYGFIENVEDFADEYGEVVDYMIEKHDPMGCNEVEEIFDEVVDIWFDWIVGRFNEIFKKPIGEWDQSELEEIIKDSIDYGVFEDFTTMCPSQAQIAEFGCYYEKVAAAFGLWDVFENEGIASAPVLYKDRGDLYEDDEIEVFTTGRQDDGAIMIRNKTNHDVKIPVHYSEEIDEDDSGSYDVIEANNEIAEVAGWPSEVCYAYYKAGGGVEGRKAAQDVYDSVEWF